MSETKNLKLFKHDEPLETNENEFDIDLALNQNWDKIDGFAEKVNNKIIELEDKNEEQDFNLQEQNTKLESKIKKDRENMINLEVEGQSIHIEDSSDLEGQLEVLGNVEQETREGYNILENILTDKTVNGITVKINKDKSITLNGTATSNTSIDITGLFAISEESVFSGMCDGYGYNKMLVQIQGADYNVNITDSRPQILQPKENVKARIYIYAGTTITNALIKPQINKGTVAKPYEQYGASPSPEYPSEIRAVGDNINLLENTAKTTTVNGVTFTVNEDGSVIVNGTATNVSYIDVNTFPFIKNNDYVLSGCPDGGSDNSYKIYCINVASGAGLTNDYGKGGAIRVGTEQTGTIRIRIASGYKADNLIFKPKLEKGTVSTSYSPYGQGSAEIKKQNKNLLKLINTSLSVSGIEASSNNETITINGTTGERSVNIYGLIDDMFLKKGTYTFYFTCQNPPVPHSFQFILCKPDGKQVVILSAWETSGYKTITLEKDTKISSSKSYLFANKNITFSNVTYKFQIQLGTKGTEIIAHQEETKILPIQKPMLEGDYFVKEIDGRKEVHGWKELILNGQENTWQLYTTGTRRFGLDLTKDLPQKETGKYATGYCTHFKVATTMTIDLTMFLQVESGHFYIGIVDKNSKWADVNALKSKLQELYNAGTPVTLYYKVETPTKLSCTPEQTKILDELDNFQTYKPVTNITTDSIAKLRLKYIADTKTYVDNKYNGLAQQILNLAGGNNNV